MIKLLSIILILCMLLSLSACKPEDADENAFVEDTNINSEKTQNEDTNNENQDADISDENKIEDMEVSQEDIEQKPQKHPEIETENITDSNVDTQIPQTNSNPETEKEDDTVTAPDYTKYECQNINEWQSVRIKNANGASIQFDLPKAWNLDKSDGNYYNISIKGKKIGTITTTEPIKPEEKYEYTSLYDEQKAIVGFTQVNWLGGDEADSFQRYFQFVADGSGLTLHISVNYTELTGSAATKIFKSAFSVPIHVNTELAPLSQTNGSKKILILGNSFIGTSKIGVFLNDMLSGSGISAEAISKGHAKITTYAADTQILNSIQKGNYSYLFISGFYGGDETISALSTIIEACEKSNTQLVVLPFHNESADTIKKVQNTYTDTVFLNWREEINSLIDSGIAKSEFCINDQYQHSTPLAGYVGAHMIYRNIFDKVPPAITSASPISMVEIQQKLGGYVNELHKSENTDIAEFTGKEYEI